MKCYIRRQQIINGEKVWGDTFFARHLGISMNPNHWVSLRQEAKQFDSVKEARWFIKMYNLKNCEVEK